MHNTIQVGKESGLIAFWLRISSLLAAVKEVCFQQAELTGLHRAVLANTFVFGLFQLMHQEDAPNTSAILFGKIAFSSEIQLKVERNND